MVSVKKWSHSRWGLPNGSNFRSKGRSITPLPRQFRSVLNVHQMGDAKSGGSVGGSKVGDLSSFDRSPLASWWGQLRLLHNSSPKSKSRCVQANMLQIVAWDRKGEHGGIVQTKYRDCQQRREGGQATRITTWRSKS